MAKTKAATKKSQRTSKETPAGDKEVTVCRRRTDRRGKKVTQESSEADAKQNEEVVQDELELDNETESQDASQNPPERRKVQRRRQIDPTTCERDYTDDEIQFMHALDAYKRSSGRMFPTCSEILEVVRGLGYEKVDRDEMIEEVIVQEVGDDSTDISEEAADDFEFAVTED